MKYLGGLERPDSTAIWHLLHLSDFGFVRWRIRDTEVGTNSHGSSRRFAVLHVELLKRLVNIALEMQLDLLAMSVARDLHTQKVRGRLLDCDLEPL